MKEPTAEPPYSIRDLQHDDYVRVCSFKIQKQTRKLKLKLKIKINSD